MVSKKLLLLIFGLLLIGVVSASSWSVDITKLNDNTIISDYSEKVTTLSFKLNDINCTDVSQVWFSDDGGVTKSSKGCAESGGEIKLTSLNSIEDTNDWMIIVENKDNTTETDSVNFWVDSIAPAITINTPTAPDYFSSLVIPFNVDIFEINPQPSAQFYVYKAGSMKWFWEYDIFSGNNNIVDNANPMSSDGTYTFNISVEDTMGHVSKSGRVVILDRVAPVASIDSPADSSLHLGDVLIESSATDDRSGIDSLELYVDGSSITSCTSENCDYTFDTTVLADGWHQIDAVATDNAGNSDTDTINIEVDNSIPVISLVGADPQVLEVFDAYTELGANALDSYYGDISSDISIDASEVDMSLLGDYSVYYDVSDLAGNPAITVTRTVSVVDTTIPVLTLNGIDPQTIEYGDAYVEQGASASDNYDGDISASIVIDDSAVDLSTLGSYTVFYDVMDSSGNPAATITRTVDVVDNTAPIITLNGIDPQVIEVGDAYVEQGASASDNYDGDISGLVVIDSSAVDTSTLGTYSVYYDVSDSFGNIALTITRTVEVVDTTIPVISLVGANPQIIEREDAYTELGASANDNYDGDISASIVIDDSAVDTDVVGTYTVSYDVLDSSGNSAITESRTITVQDTIAPSIEILSPIFNVTYTSNDIELNVSSDEAGTWKYSTDAGVTNTTFTPNTTINLANGDYNLFVYVADASGNENSTNVSFSVNYVASVSSGGRSSSCTNKYNCTYWGEWSACDNGAQLRTCIAYKIVGCSHGVSLLDIKNGEVRNCVLGETSSNPEEIVFNPSENTEDTSDEGASSGITGGVIGFAKTRTGITAISVVGVLLISWVGLVLRRRFVASSM